jgi:hypothetical protein
MPMGDSNTVATRFRIASITKTFTAALVLKLVEEGRLKVTDTLTSISMSVPVRGSAHVHHCLRTPRGFQTTPVQPISQQPFGYTPEEIAATFLDRPPNSVRREIQLQQLNYLCWR